MLGSPMKWLAAAFLVLWSWGLFAVAVSFCDADQYKAQVTQLEADAVKLKEKYAALQKVVGEQSAALSDNEEQRKQAEEQANKLQGRINELENLTTTAVGF